MEIPSSLVVTDAGYALDGGSISLRLRGPDGARHTLDLPQHLLADPDPESGPPGALMFDGGVVPVRGDDEAALLAVLRNATYEGSRSLRRGAQGLAPPERRIVIGADIEGFIAAVDRGPEHAVRHLLDRVLSFVESDAYVDVARRFGRVP